MKLDSEGARFFTSCSTNKCTDSAKTFSNPAFATCGKLFRK